jgi:Rrf2 family protein
MGNVLKISDAASLALHVMVILAENPDELTPAKQAADVLYVSEAHLSKVLQRLGKVNLVMSTRGPGGGFRLANPPGETNLLEVYEAIDGRLDEDNCLLHNKACKRENCILGGINESLNSQIRDYLSGTTLNDLIEKAGVITK